MMTEGLGRSIDAYAESKLTAPESAMDRLGYLADNADRIGDVLEGFLARWHGGGPVSSGAQATAPMPTGHLANIDRLGKNLSRLEELAQSLRAIG